jgi:hypothetical protein
MSTNNNDLPDPDRPNDAQQGPGSHRMKPRWIVLVAVYLVVVSAFVLYGLIKLWPYPTPSGERPTADQGVGSQAPTNNQSNTSPSGAANPQSPVGDGGGTTTPASGSGQPQPQTRNPASVPGGPQKPPLPDPELIKFFGGRFVANVFLETRLLILVMLAGALGSLMHALRSLYWYTGNRMMVWSWVAFYFLLPVTGAMLATIFYFVVRGGFFSSTASFETTSPFGFAALSALVGLFSPQATLKLKEVAETIFAKPEAGADNKPQEPSPTAPPPKAAPAISSVTPDSGAVNESVVISGTGFSEGVAVKFGGVAAVVSSVSETSLTAVAPANPSATGPVDVEVTNSDGQSVIASQKFTYIAGGATDAAAMDELDGHDEIKSNTTDEDLPITEGGVG